MMRAWPLLLGALGLVPALTACPSGDDVDSMGAASTSDSGTATPSDSGPDPDSGTTTSEPTPDTNDDGSTTETTNDDNGSTTETTNDGGSSSSSDDGCVPGTEGCPCDAGRCEGRLMCLGELCQTPACEGDAFEENEDESTAVYLGAINDNDGNGDIVNGSLHFPGDVDWYYYEGDDDFGNTVNPSRELVSSGGLRMCKFFECNDGLAVTEFSCPPGTDYALSPMARAGCCTDGDVEIEDLNCTGTTEDSAMVYIRIDQPEGDCVSYSVSYHY